MLLDTEFQPRPSVWGVAKWYVIVFLVTALAVYGWGAGHRRPGSADRGGTAKAVISVQAAARSETGQPALPLPTAAALRSQITTEQYIAQALAHCDERWSRPRSMEKICRGLQVNSEHEANPDAVIISLSLSDEDLAFASGVVNALADRYAEGLRTRLRDEAQKKYRLAAEALDEARQKLRRAKAELEGFLERHFREHEELARRALAASRAGAAGLPAAPQSPLLPAGPSVMVDNPEWVRIHEQLQAKRRSLAEILTVRTRLHPEAQERQSDIADLERRLIATPRQVARPADEGPVAQARVSSMASAAPGGLPAAAAPGVPAEEQLDATQTFATLSGELRRAAENETRQAQDERIAWQEQFCLPSLKSTTASQPALESAAAGTGAFWVALIAGMAVASGVGMIFSRPGADRLITSVGQAERALGSPVLGVIRAADLPDELPAELGSNRRKLMWVLGGIACVAGAVALVLVAG